VSNQAFNHEIPSADSRIRLVHLISDLSIGGAEMMLYKLLAETDLNRFAPVVVSLIDRGDLRERIEALGIPVHMVGLKAGIPSPMGFWRLVRLMRSLNPDFILGWMYHSCLAAILTKYFLPRRTKVFWSIHYANHSLASEKRLTVAVIKLCARLSRLADKIIFVSRASQAQHKQFGYFLGRSCVIPNGINTREFVPSKESRESVRAELGLSEDAVLIGMIGRYHPTKDHPNFLRAASLISRQHPDANFAMIGHGLVDENSELRQLIDSSDLAHRVHLLGERHDISRIAAALDVFALSSFSESFPNVIGEAMACEVACTVTHVGDAAWIVGDAGSVVPPRDPHALAAAMSEMIELGERGRVELGRRARARVIERFQLNSVVAQYETLYSTFPPHGAFDDFASNSKSLPVPRLKPHFDESSVG
jgi:glycosyltransferase involved in cell wall biosynthesis